MTQPLTAEQKRELRELEAKATPGDWGWMTWPHPSGAVYDAPINSGYPRRIFSEDGPNADNNIKFVAVSRKSIKPLLDENEALEAGVRRLEGELAHRMKIADFYWLPTDLLRYRRYRRVCGWAGLSPVNFDEWRRCYLNPRHPDYWKVRPDPSKAAQENSKP